jgi:hypothetical protein
MRRWEIGVLVALSVFLSLVYYYPILRSGNNLGIQDWDQNFAWTEATRVSLIDYHQFPLWNPYKCGGSVQFANPQIPVISFQTVFALLFGTVRGIKFSIFFHGVLGFIGFYFLARQYKLSYMGSLLASIIFSFSGITGSFLSTGMVVFTSFAYIPFVLLCFNKCLEKGNGKWGIICGALFALSFYWGYHIPLLLGIYILVYSLITSIVKRTFSPLKALFMVSISSALMILPKLILSVQLIRIFPRSLEEISGYSLHNFFYFLLSQKQNLFNEMNTQGFYNGIDENSLYVGLVPLVLFLLFFVRNKKGIGNHLSLVFTLLIIFGIMLGNAIHPSLYALIKHLPVFSSFRVAQRFRFDFIIPFTLLTGLGLDNIGRLLQRYKLAMPVAVLGILVIFADLVLFSSTNFLSKTLIIKNPEAQLSSENAFAQTDAKGADFEIHRTIQIPDKFLDSDIFTPWSYEYLKIEQNKGVLNCYDSITTTVNAAGIEDEKYRGEFYLVNPVQGVKVENTFWSPNKLVFKITNLEKAVNNILIINQNYYPGWIVKTDTKPCQRAIYSNGLLATRLDPLSKNITFQFNPFLRWFRCRN